MGGRGSSSGGSSEKAAGKSKPVTYDNMELAGREVMESFAKAAANATERIPELKGNPYVNLEEIDQADIKTPGVLAFYGTESRKIVVGNKTLNYDSQSEFHPEGTGNLDGVVAHELGHALSYHKLPGFRNVDEVLHIAHGRYNRENKENLTRAEFMRKISAYAAEDAHEAFAEAFSDWTINGINASKASLAMMGAWSEKTQGTSIGTLRSADVIGTSAAATFVAGLSQGSVGDYVRQATVSGGVLTLNPLRENSAGVEPIKQGTSRPTAANVTLEAGIYRNGGTNKAPKIESHNINWASVNEVKGDTYALRETLKEKGFTWNAMSKSWVKRGPTTATAGSSSPRQTLITGVSSAMDEIEKLDGGHGNTKKMRTVADSMNVFLRSGAVAESDLKWLSEPMSVEHPGKRLSLLYQRLSSRKDFVEFMKGRGNG
jgi:hypothetical protein